VNWSINLITAPAQEPIELDGLKRHSRIDTTEDDPYLTLLITACRQHIEAITGRALITQTLELQLDEWQDDDVPILLTPPLQSVSSVKYLDTEGVEQTIASPNYTVHAPSGIDCSHGRLVNIANFCWPPALGSPGAIRIRHVSGYGPDSANVPGPLRQSMLWLAAHLYERREPVTDSQDLREVPLTLRYMLSPYRLYNWSGPYGKPRRAAAA
jgi:uncharacterized phiE125 gp8 family phage protein